MPPVALADTIAGEVLEDVCAALRGLATGDGYHWDVAANQVATEPRNLLGVPSTSRPYFLLELSPTGSRSFEPADQLTHYQRILLTVIADAPPLETAGPDRKSATALALIADIERVLTRDITRDGLCSDTRLQEPEVVMGLGESNSVVVIQEIECRIHRTYGAP